MLFTITDFYRLLSTRMARGPPPLLFSAFSHQQRQRQALCAEHPHNFAPLSSRSSPSSAHLHLCRLPSVLRHRHVKRSQIFAVLGHRHVLERAGVRHPRIRQRRRRPGIVVIHVVLGEALFGNLVSRLVARVRIVGVVAVACYSRASPHDGDDQGDGESDAADDDQSENDDVVDGGPAKPVEGAALADVEVHRGLGGERRNPSIAQLDCEEVQTCGREKISQDRYL